MTIETTYSQAREQLKSLMDRAVNDREIIVVRRRTGGDVAMIAADELAGLVETAHLLRSEKNAERLLSASIDPARRGETLGVADFVRLLQRSAAPVETRASGQAAAQSVESR